LLTAALVPAMIEAGAGSIINVGSVNGVTGMSGAALYGASKAALHGMTKAWAAEWAQHGVRVNTVAPGPTATDLNVSVADQLDGLVSGVPSRRMSEPAEVAAVVSFLASDEATHIHGATIPVDGGLTATFPM
jgi:NAD(P)-dependent dehydrogenase (short-subunit alcohol dehydrogenase family)